MLEMANAAVSMLRMGGMVLLTLVVVSLVPLGVMGVSTSSQSSGPSHPSPASTLTFEAERSTAENDASNNDRHPASLSSPPPNVLFIVVDDLNPTLSTYGHDVITPGIERLAKMSTQFNRAYVSMAVCAPSRTAFLTGLRPDTTQVWTIGPYFRNVSRGQGMQIVSLPQAFRMRGYNTTGAGKIFHPGTPSGGMISSTGGGDQCPEHGDGRCQWSRSGPGKTDVASWTEPYNFCDQYVNDTVQSPAMQGWPCSKDAWPSCGLGCVQPPSCEACFRRAGTWGKTGLAYYFADCPDSCYPEGLIANKAIASLEYHAAHPEQPFFLAVGFKRPHLSYKTPKSYAALYDIANISLPLEQTFPSSLPPITYTHNCMVGAKDVAPYGVAKTCVNSSTEGSACHEWVTNTTTIRMLRLAYKAAVSLMDHHLERVLDALETTGLAENTIVTFIGDHGYQNAQKSLWCKSTNFELATRIPMFVSVPPSLGGGRNSGGQKVDTIVESIDLFPTLLELAGLSTTTTTTTTTAGNNNDEDGQDKAITSQALAGESLVPLLGIKKKNNKDKTRRKINSEYDRAAMHEDTKESNATIASAAATAGRKVSQQVAKIPSPLPSPPHVGSYQKTFALSQWPRRESCVHNHGCVDGHGDPSVAQPDKAMMGYTLRTTEWRYGAWFPMDWDKSTPIFETVYARELYSHKGDTGNQADTERFENFNQANDPALKDIVAQLHAQLLAAVKSGLRKPLDKPGH